MNGYNVSETTITSDNITAEKVDRVTDKNLNLADFVQHDDDTNIQPSEKSTAPLFDNLTLFLIMMAIGLITSITVCNFFGNWYLGFMLGGYLGTALGIVALSIRKLCSKSK